ncbi:MAG: PstA family ABC transporter permease, partial [Candidatus Ratteibacteria bacterium]
PSIVIGIIGYIWVVKRMGHFSAISGSVALSLIFLPIIIKSTKETLKMIPFSIIEASLSLGISYPKTILKVILPSGINGILSGILLGLARISGETAPLLFTAFGNPFINLNITKPVSSLPHIIFVYAISPYDNWRKHAWGCGVILIIFVFILNFVSKYFSKKWNIKF